MDAGAREYAHGCAFERKERDVTAELRGAGFELDTPLTGYLLCFFLRFHCLATARQLQTKQKSLKSISVRGACSYRNAVFTHAMTKTAVNNFFIS
ncbi:MAG: hypothetical protein FWG48_06750, partial [Oscillospiraceae bacterium]|nr:hypothetical protein [Oscillospiraceae bacterium]